MTPRTHYNQIQTNIEGSKSQLALLKVFESNNVKEIQDSLSIICDELKLEINKDRGDAYGKTSKEEVIKSAEDMLNVKEKATFSDLQAIGQALYDRYINEVIRTYAYDLYKKGEVKDYKRLANEMIDCMLADLKEDGLYDGEISKNIDKEVNY